MNIISLQRMLRIGSIMLLTNLFIVVINAQEKIPYADSLRSKVNDQLKREVTGIKGKMRLQTDTLLPLKEMSIQKGEINNFLSQPRDIKTRGQYALYTYNEEADTYTYIDRNINVIRFYNLNDAGNSEIYNFSFVNEAGSSVYIRDMSESDFIQAYMNHPEWADMFVKKHIEYCSYLFCKDQSYSPANKNNETSYTFDKTLRELVNTGSDAVSKGYYNRSNMYALLDADPFFNGGRGSSLKTSMAGDLGSLSTAIGFKMYDAAHNPLAVKNIFQFIDWMLYCKPVSGTDDAVINSWTASCSPAAACRSVAREWELYRNYYLNLKSKYLHQVKEQVSPGCTDCFIGKDAMTASDNSSMLLACGQNVAPWSFIRGKRCFI